MDNSDVINLLRVEEETDESGTQHSAIFSTRTVLCRINSVGMKESYAAQAIGHNPELRVTIAEATDYEGETYVAYNWNVYKVLRTYQSGISVELTLERTRDLEGMI